MFVLRNLCFNWCINMSEIHLSVNAFSWSPVAVPPSAPPHLGRGGGHVPPPHSTPLLAGAFAEKYFQCIFNISLGVVRSLPWGPCGVSGSRAVATIGAGGARPPPHQSVCPPPNIWEIKILSYFNDDSVETPKFKYYFVKFRGLRPRTPFYCLIRA